MDVAGTVSIPQLVRSDMKHIRNTNGTKSSMTCTAVHQSRVLCAVCTDWEWSLLAADS
jgi:hypothetical protein